jgi:hypothetical protein
MVARSPQTTHRAPATFAPCADDAAIGAPGDEVLLRNGVPRASGVRRVSGVARVSVLVRFSGPLRKGGRRFKPIA